MGEGGRANHVPYGQVKEAVVGLLGLSVNWVEITAGEERRGEAGDYRRTLETTSDKRETEKGRRRRIFKERGKNQTKTGEDTATHTCRERFRATRKHNITKGKIQHGNTTELYVDANAEVLPELRGP